MPNNNIEWKCTECGTLIENGYLSVSLEDGLHNKFLKNVCEVGRHNSSTTFRGLEKSLRSANWRALHDYCGAKEGNTQVLEYSINTADVTYQSLLLFTLNMSGKTWLSGTDWVSFIKSKVMPERLSAET
jgi:hypothetical protein